MEAATRKPDLVILDLGLPDLDGVEVVRRLREWSAVPIDRPVGARARAGQDRRARRRRGRLPDQAVRRGRAAGAPARGAPARAPRAASRASRRFASGTSRSISRRGASSSTGAEAHLTPIEYRLLAVLVRHAGLVVTHRQLLRDVWGPAYVEHTHTLRVHMAGLRRKIEREPARPRYLLTELGVGYRLAAE